MVKLMTPDLLNAARSAFSTSPGEGHNGTASPAAEARIAAYDWIALVGQLEGYGCAVLPKLLTADECGGVAALYPDESHFRSHVVMARHGFAKGNIDTSDIRFPT